MNIKNILIKNRHEFFRNNEYIFRPYPSIINLFANDNIIIYKIKKSIIKYVLNEY